MEELDQIELRQVYLRMLERLLDPPLDWRCREIGEYSVKVECPSEKEASHIDQTIEPYEDCVSGSFADVQNDLSLVMCRKATQPKVNV